MTSARKKPKFYNRPYKPRNRPKKRKFQHRPYKPRKPKAKGSPGKKPRRADAVLPYGGDGTGFLVTSNGHIITNYHVAEAGAQLRVRLHSKVFPANVVKLDRLNDLALLKIEATTAPLSLGKDADLNLASEVHAIGFPHSSNLGVTPKYSRGTVSGTHGLNDFPGHFQISAPVEAGNSGGPVFDDLGNVVGVVVSKYTKAANIAYAIKVKFVRRLLLLAGINMKSLPSLHKHQRPLATDIIPEVVSSTVRVMVHGAYGD